MADRTVNVTLALNDDMSKGLDSLSKQLDTISGKLAKAGSDANSHSQGIRGLLEQFEKVSRSHREEGGRVGQIFDFMKGKVGEAGKGLEGIIKNLGVLKTSFAGTSLSAEAMAGTLTKVGGAIGAVGFALYKGGEEVNSWINRIAEMHVKLSLFRESIGATNDRVIDSWRTLGQSLDKSSDESDSALSRIVGLLDDARKGYDSNLAHISELHPGMMTEFNKWFDEIAHQGKKPIEVVTEFMQWADKQTPEFRRQLAQETGLQFDFLSNRAAEIRKNMRPVWEPPDAAFKQLEEQKDKLTKLNEEWKQAWADWAKWATFNIESLVIPSLVKVIEWINKAIDVFKKIETQVPKDKQVQRGPGIGPILTPFLRDMMQPQKFTEGNDLREVNTGGKETNIHLREIRDVMEWLKAQIEGKGGGGGGAWNGPGSGPTAPAPDSNPQSSNPPSAPPAAPSNPASTPQSAPPSAPPAAPSNPASAPQSAPASAPPASTSQSAPPAAPSNPATPPSAPPAAPSTTHQDPPAPASTPPASGPADQMSDDSRRKLDVGDIYNRLHKPVQQAQPTVDWNKEPSYGDGFDNINARGRWRQSGSTESFQQWRAKDLSGPRLHSGPLYEGERASTNVINRVPGTARRFSQSAITKSEEWISGHAKGAFSAATDRLSHPLSEDLKDPLSQSLGIGDIHKGPVGIIGGKIGSYEEQLDRSKIDKSLGKQASDSSKMTQTKLAINVSGAPRGTRINAKGDGVFSNVALHRTDLGQVSVAMESNRKHTTELG